jgi:hypothetical protein
MNMKKLAIASLLCLGISGFTSCDKVKDLTNVNINLDNADGILTLPVIPVAGTASLGAAEVSVNLDSMIKAQNSQVSADNIKEVHIKSCELVMLDGNSSNNFSALQSCSLKISSDQNTTPQTIAEVTDNPDTEAYSLNLPVNTGLELKGYFLNAKKFTYSVAGTARKATTKEIKCQVKVKYNLVIGL